MKRILATMLLFLSGCSAIQEYPGTGCTSETAPFVSSVAPIDDDDEVADGVKQPMRPDAEVDESIDVWGLKLQ